MTWKIATVSLLFLGLLGLATAEHPTSESALRKNLGRKLASLRRDYPRLAYAWNDDQLGNYWVCNANFGIYTRKGTVTLVTIRASNVQIQGVSVGDSVRQMESRFGEAETMRIQVCSLSMGQQRTQPVVMEYPERHLLVLCKKGKVMGILLTGRQPVL